MKFIVTIILLMTLYCCDAQVKTNSTVYFEIVNKSELSKPLNIQIISHEGRNKLVIEDVNKQIADTTLECKKPYSIILSSEGFLSEKFNFFNKNCSDTNITITLKPLEVYRHRRDSNGVIID